MSHSETLTPHCETLNVECQRTKIKCKLNIESESRILAGIEAQFLGDMFFTTCTRRELYGRGGNQI